MAWWHRVVNAVRPARVEQDIDRELSFHLAERADELRAQGASPDEAMRQARLHLGNVTLQAERTRDADMAVWLDRLARDLHLAVRRLCRVPRFTAAVIATLGLSMGATTAIFTVVSSILLQPLPFSKPDRLIALQHRAPGRPGPDEPMAASPALYFTYRDHARTLESVALYFTNTATISGVVDPEEVDTLRVTHEFLPTLRVRPALGRVFSEADDRPGAARTVMLSYGYWQRRFGGASHVVGRFVIVDGAPHEIIGVLPQTFRFTQQPAAILTAAQLNRAFALTGPIGERGIARLRPGVTIDAANADARRLIPVMRSTFPLVGGLTQERFDSSRFGPDFVPLKDSLVGGLRDVLWLLMGTMAILLMVACANVANLLLVRADGRGHELAVQAALGASRATLTRGLLVESMLLAVAGAAAGLALTRMSLPLVLRLADAELPGAFVVTLDGRVLLFALGSAILAGLVFGLLPAMRYGTPRAITIVRDSGRTQSDDPNRHRVRNTLVVAQVAMALVLLVGCALMIRTFLSLRDVSAGFDVRTPVQIVRLSFPQASIPDFSRVTRLQQDIVERVAAIPGVHAVGFSTRTPLLRTGPSGPFSFEDKPHEPSLETQFRYVSPGFLAALRAPLVAGRDLTWADGEQKRQVAVVSASLARREWGSPAAAIGKHMRRSSATPWIEIVGVADDVRHDGLDQRAPDTVYLTSSEMFAPFATRTLFFFVRSPRSGTSALIADISNAVWSVNNDLPIGGVQTLSDVYDRSVARRSLTLTLLTITASMALLLGLIGVSAVISYTLAQRSREFGIRMALGASHTILQGVLIRDGLRLVAVGVAIGLVGAVTLTRFMESLLFGVEPIDALTYAAVTAALVVTAAITIYLPLRRVIRIDLSFRAL